VKLKISKLSAANVIRLKQQRKQVKVNSVQEHDNKTITFNGELSPEESSLVVAFGLNTMLAMGLMSMVPNVETNEFTVESPMQ